MFVTVAAAMLERGEAPPPPASQGGRTAQVNVRLTAEEKLALEAAASREGFTGVSEFVRAKVLAGAGLTEPGDGGRRIRVKSGMVNEPARWGAPENLKEGVRGEL